MPLAAVAAANCVNIPLMRVTELQNGIELQTEDGTKVGHSKRAAKQAIATVTLSRILMASPSMSKFRSNQTSLIKSLNEFVADYTNFNNIFFSIHITMWFYY